MQESNSEKIAWPTRIKEHILYIPYFALFFTGMFFAKSWLNFHIPLHALYLAGKKVKEIKK